MAPLNGNLKIIVSVLAILSVGTGVTGYVYNMGHQVEDNEKEIVEHEAYNMAEFAEIDAECTAQWLDIDSNTRHQNKDLVDTEYIKRDMAIIQKDVAGLKQVMDDFATEQREMNLEILGRLPSL